MNVSLTAGELEALKTINAPTISNAIEVFNIKARNQGFMGPEIKCIYRDMEPMVGYACTAVIRANQSPPKGQAIDPRELWEEVLKTPEPRVLVIKDMDYPNPVGSFWGEVNANVYRALGCVGTV
ncbi:MAG: RraA family protein, partial [Dehalococcoidia bacterium]